MAAWQAAGLDLAVAVNLSAQQFQQKNLLRRLDAVLEETRINRARLELEITESAAMHDPEHTAEVLRSMKQRGLTLALDDFESAIRPSAICSDFHWIPSRLTNPSSASSAPVPMAPASSGP